ncbi:hypothetical protein F0L68_20890 [Solihabitans fulvus]|uniref:Uncharacterized protein n=1 Tax=Solihabitans fulvus TaxID=1892852 RepID=A0A5B2X884_9PSEU|nr:hypothetical protein [Solihabitans fulvus]KAA2259403.1 hypothetical protein F0L68_20890 [Solihabitans fulvus]
MSEDPVQAIVDGSKVMPIDSANRLQITAIQAGLDLHGQVPMQEIVRALVEAGIQNSDAVVARLAAKYNVPPISWRTTE